MIADNENNEEEYHAVPFEEAPDPVNNPEVVRKGTGRNDLCPCNSGLKYKKCHIKSEKGLLPQEMRSLMHLLIKTVRGVAVTQRMLDEYPDDAEIHISFDKNGQIWKVIVPEPTEPEVLVPRRKIITDPNFG